MRPHFPADIRMNALPDLRSFQMTPDQIVVAERWLTKVAAERHQLSVALQELAVREENLHAYEAHLRGGQPAPAPAPAPAPVSPQSEAEADAAWQKWNRALELLEAEEAHLRNDRLELRDEELTLQRRTEAIAAREADIVAREQRLARAAAVVQEQAAPEPHEGVASAVARLMMRASRPT